MLTGGDVLCFQEQVMCDGAASQRHLTHSSLKFNYTRDTDHSTTVSSLLPIWHLWQGLLLIQDLDHEKGALKPLTIAKSNYDTDFAWKL
jgi:hypothetical protein